MTEVIGIDHIYMTVSDRIRSENFYDLTLKDTLGFRKNEFVINYDPHVQYFNRHFSFVIRTANNGPSYNSYAPGLHHLCFRVESIEDVMVIENRLRSLGVEVSTAQNYPEYARDYWAIFVTDPDGIRLEITNYRQERKERHDKWCS